MSASSLTVQILTLIWSMQWPYQTAKQVLANTFLQPMVKGSAVQSAMAKTCRSMLSTISFSQRVRIRLGPKSYVEETSLTLFYQVFLQNQQGNFFHRAWMYLWTSVLHSEPSGIRELNLPLKHIFWNSADPCKSKHFTSRCMNKGITWITEFQNLKTRLNNGQMWK